MSVKQVTTEDLLLLIAWEFDPTLLKLSGEAAFHDM